MNTLRIALVALLATFALRAGADPIHDAAKGNDVGKIKTLLNASPGAIKATDPFGRSPLGVAAHNGGKEAAAALIAAGADLNFRDNFLQTPIFWALLNGHTDLVELLLEKKADPNAKSRAGDTPLKLARKQDNKRATELLIKHGAKE